MMSPHAFWLVGPGRRMEAHLHKVPCASVRRLGLKRKAACIANALFLSGKGGFSWMWLRGPSGGGRAPLRPPLLAGPRPTGYAAPVPRPTDAERLRALLDVPLGQRPASPPTRPRHQGDGGYPGVRHEHQGEVRTLSGEAAAKRARVEDDTRLLAVSRIIDVVSRRCASVVIDAARLEPGGLHAEAPTIIDTVAKRSTGTLRKRASSLLLFDAWLAEHAPEGTPLNDEPTVHRYLRTLLQDKAPASRGPAVLSAIHFIGNAFAVYVASVLSSSRVAGASARLQATRAEVVQRDPLTVTMVAALEGVVLNDRGQGTYRAVIAGAALFALFSRSRVGDLRRCSVEPVLDGRFLETRFLEHKTARPGTRRALPIVAPVFGVSGNWGEAWVATRRAAGLDANRNLTVLPVRADTGGWHNVALTTDEFAKAFREVLLGQGVDASGLSNIGSHSLKVTCLSWAGKFGLNRDTRRMLGYHADPSAQVVETYSRDVMAKPLRQLESVIKEIREMRFHPDSTRSGVFSVERTPASLDIRGGQLPEVASASSARGPSTPRVSPPRSPRASSLSPSSSSASSAFSEGGPDAPEDGPVTAGCIIMNSASGVHHVAAGATHMVCRKVLPLRFVRVATLDADARKCSVCL